jgi:tRNA-specific 2-thiouridylase
MLMGKNKGKVLVAMSGGVDSSVAAGLLKEKGYDVIGVTMQIWPKDGASAEHTRSCCSLSAVEDAKRVAHLLGIPHYVLNFRKIFEEKIIKNFINEYSAGRTPNPCVRCNEHIKFDALLKKADELGAEFIATGHYARVSKGRSFSLLKGMDPKKDQSYMLYVMGQESLSRTMFPNGGLKKDEVREIARSLGLPVAEKEDSQEICFVPNDDYGEFLKKFVLEDVKPGPILDSAGNILGMHKGIVYYTVGQRRGLGIPRPEPLYVVSIDKESNAIVVGDKKETLGSELLASRVNFVSGETPGGKLEVNAKIRYNAKESRAVLEQGDEMIRVKFTEPQNAITPGQSVVFYNGEVVLGGGIIEKAL